MFADLSGEGREQFVLLQRFGGQLYEPRDGSWALAGRVYSVNPSIPPEDLLADLAQGAVSTKEPHWKQLWIGKRQFRVMD